MTNGKGALDIRRRMICGRRCLAPSNRRAGFTIVELLIVIAVIGVLLALLAPALRGGIARARGFRCQMSLRTVAFDFATFADPDTAASRGDDDELYGPNRFSLETFIEAQYGVDEFWPKEVQGKVTQRSTDPQVDGMRCAEVRGPVEMRRGVACRAGAIGPTENVSFGFNARLFRVEVHGSRGPRPRLTEATLTADIMSRGMVPLVWDIDGALAASKDAVPHFTAPSIEPAGPYADNALWFPGLRHSGQGNFALIDGSVHATPTPLQRTSWMWSYQARP